MNVIKEEIICRMFVTLESHYIVLGDQFLKVSGIT
jgi:hypothetical protein